MNTTQINNTRPISLFRRLAAGAVMAAGIAAGALGTAGLSHAETATAPLPHNNDSSFTHPAFPGYSKSGLPGYSPSPRIAKRHAYY